MMTRYLKYFWLVCFSITLTHVAYADFVSTLIVCERAQEGEFVQSAVERLNKRLANKAGLYKVVTQGEDQIVIGAKTVCIPGSYSLERSTFSAPTFIAERDGTTLVCLTIDSPLTEEDYKVFLRKEARWLEYQKQLELKKQQRDLQNSKSSKPNKANKPNFFKKFFSEPSTSGLKPLLEPILENEIE